MKTIVANACLGLALAAAGLPLMAQHIGSPNARTERVTLLPGPTLLSPARGAPQSTNNIAITPAELVHSLSRPQVPVGEFRFRAAAPGEKRPVAAPKTTAASPALTPARPSTTPPPESLKFDATLHPSKSEPRTEFVPATSSAAGPRK